MRTGGRWTTAHPTEWRFSSATLLLAACLLLSACGTEAPPTCTARADADVRKDVIEAIRPKLEFTRSDGSRYTLQDYISHQRLDVFVCGDYFSAEIRPIASGALMEVLSERFVLERETLRIVDWYSDGRLGYPHPTPQPTRLK